MRHPEVIGMGRTSRAEQDNNITAGEARQALLRLDPLWDELFRGSRPALCSCWSTGSTCVEPASISGFGRSRDRGGDPAHAESHRIQFDPATVAFPRGSEDNFYA